MKIHLLETEVEARSNELVRYGPDIVPDLVQVLTDKLLVLVYLISPVHLRLKVEGEIDSSVPVLVFWWRHSSVDPFSPNPFRVELLFQQLRSETPSRSQQGQCPDTAYGP